MNGVLREKAAVLQAASFSPPDEDDDCSIDSNGDATAIDSEQEDWNNGSPTETLMTEAAEPFNHSIKVKLEDLNMQQDEEGRGMSQNELPEEKGGKREEEGYVRLTHKDGVYYGQVNAKGVPHGYGEESRNSGQTYKGQYELGHRQGHGVMIRSGQKYVGEFLSSKYHGHGEMDFADGSRYVG